MQHIRTQINISILFCHFALKICFLVCHLSVVLLNTKMKISNFNVNMSMSYMNVNNNINIYYQELIFLNYILPFKLCLFFLKIQGDLPPFSNGYVCESLSIL